MDLALNNLKRLIFYKTQTNKQTKRLLDYTPMTTKLSTALKCCYLSILLI